MFVNCMCLQFHVRWRSFIFASFSTCSSHFLANIIDHLWLLYMSRQLFRPFASFRWLKLCLVFGLECLALPTWDFRAQSWFFCSLQSKTLQHLAHDLLSLLSLEWGSDDFPWENKDLHSLLAVSIYLNIYGQQILTLCILKTNTVNMKKMINVLMITTLETRLSRTNPVLHTFTSLVHSLRLLQKHTNWLYARNIKPRNAWEAWF